MSQNNWNIEDWKKSKDGSKKKIHGILRKVGPHKGPHLDRLAGQVHKEVFTQVNCLECANCCTSIPPMVTNSDAKRLADLLKLSITEFHLQYLRLDEDGDQVMNSSPCPFLQEDNSCRVYDHRPKACRNYPHTDEDQFSSSLKVHEANAHHCPAAFYILQEIEGRLP